MAIPPVLALDDVTCDVIEDLKDASAIYCGPDYWSMTSKFDDLMLVPERSTTVAGFLAGEIPAIRFGQYLKDWLLKPWSSTRSIGEGRMARLADALAEVRVTMAEIPADTTLEDADRVLLAKMVAVFKCLDACYGVGPTIASKILAPLRPALFAIWDNPIADAYGFALNAAGYHQYLNVTQAIARKVRGFWHSPIPLEQHLKPNVRTWIAPLAKVIDEWNWIRITRKHAYLRSRHSSPCLSRPCLP